VSNSKTFEQLLNVFWLRPETAMWREIDIRAMQTFEVHSPSLDLGCGDGIFSFIRAGGEFSNKFDAFRSMASLDEFFNNVDVFDSYDDSVSPNVVQKPNYNIDCGFDYKDNLLKKSGRLGLYKELKQGDANKALPFADESFNSIFSNIIYWLDDPKAVLKEIERILMPDGKVCLMLPNKTLPEFSFYNELYMKTGDQSWAFLENLDRGRFADNIRQARSSDTWEDMFQDAGLTVLKHNTHLSKVAIQIWDVGLRPLFPVLRKMIDAIESEKLPDIKQEWINTVRQFLEPIVKMDERLVQDAEHAFHCYILEK
jgi:SAM-dependent methyltransferase